MSKRTRILLFDHRFTLRPETEENNADRLSYKIAEYWRKINEYYIKPKLICDFPDSIEEDEELSNGIKHFMESKMVKKKSDGNLKLSAKLSLQTIDIDALQDDNTKNISKKGSCIGNK